MTIGLVLLAVAAANIKPSGSPPEVVLGPSRIAHEIDAEVGLRYEVTGPANVLIELRSQTRGKRVVLNITRDDRWVSENAVKLRRVGRAAKGYDYVALLAFKVPEGTSSYRLTATSGGIVAVLTSTSSFLKQFRASPERDMTVPEEQAQPPPPQETVADATSTTTQSDTTSAGAGAGAGGGDLVFDIAGELESAGVDATFLQEANQPQTTESVQNRLTLADEALAIGGVLWPRFTVRARDEGQAADYPFANRNLVDVYFDTRPADQLRGYLRGRFVTTYEASSTPGAPAVEDYRFLLDQLWLKWNIDRTVYVTLGKQPLRWGAGRFWNPADLLHTRPVDPLAVFDERTGLDLLKVHFPIESLGWNLYAIADFGGAQSGGDLASAFRAELLVLGAEISMSTVLRRDHPTPFALEVNSPLWIFDLRGEVVTSQGYVKGRWTGDFDLASGVVPSEADKPETPPVQAVASLEYRFKYHTHGDQAAEDEIVIAAEYFHNELGYKRKRLLPWLVAQNDFEPLYASRRYFGAAVTVPKPSRFDDVTFILSYLTSLDDKSWLGRFDMRLTLLTYMSLDAAVQMYGGPNGVFKLSFDQPATTVPGFEEGLRREAGFIDVSVGLQIAM